MKKTHKILLITILIVLLLAWSPWITKKYAINKVIQMHNRSNDYSYEDRKIDQLETIVNHISKRTIIVDENNIDKVTWLPFVRRVYTSGEGYYMDFFVTFWGNIF